jgi:putative inorganic carbon (HCO3(-)) transporter
MAVARATSSRGRVTYAVAAALALCIGVATAYVPSTSAMLGAALTVVGSVALLVTSRIGADAAAACFALLAMALSGMLDRYVPGAGVLNQAGVLALIVVAVARVPRSLPRALTVPTALFVAVSTIAAVLALRGGTSFAARGWIALICAPAAATAVAGVLDRACHSAPRREEVRRWLLGALTVIVAANIVVGFRQAVLGFDAREIAAAARAESTYLVGDQIRLMGTFSVNQEFGLLASCFSPALLIATLRARGSVRTWLLSLTVAMYAVTFLSLTRTSLIASVGSGLVAVLVWSGRTWSTRVVRTVAFVVVVVAASAIVLSVFRIERVNDALERAATLFSLESDKSFRARADENLPFAISVFSEHPFGLGAGAAGPVSQQYPAAAPLGTITTDNGYLMIAIQLGIVGLIAFVWMLTAALRCLARTQTTISTAAAAAILGLLLAMATAQYWSLLPPIAAVGALVGIGLADGRAPSLPVRA